MITRTMYKVIYSPPYKLSYGSKCRSPTHNSMTIHFPLDVSIIHLLKEREKNMFKKNFKIN